MKEYTSKTPVEKNRIPNLWHIYNSRILPQNL